jgi:DNA mismatch repair ATPase MutS
VARVLGSIGTAERDLALVAALLARLEREPFASPKLAALRASLMTKGVAPSVRIGQLRRLVSWLDSDENLLFKPIAYALLWRPIFASAIDRWHAAYGPAVAAWLVAIGELEALSALATQAYEHPGDPFPEIVEPGPLFEARALGHPLIADAAAVRNDVAIGARARDGGPQADEHAHPRVLIVSGSNMSGKSTLLRAVGINVVLALAGGVVRAAALRVSPLAIGATIRIEDSLQEGHSRFYTEILRIRAVVEKAGGPLPVVFLLDEVLHGTNSRDRRIGAGAIVRALVERGAIGLVTTHDLALTELAATMGGAAANVHFEDRIENGKMVFDYRMRPGVVERSNALELMRAIGLDV